jgi:hypothetical protein
VNEQLELAVAVLPALSLGAGGAYLLGTRARASGVSAIVANLALG